MLLQAGPFALPLLSRAYMTGLQGAFSILPSHLAYLMQKPRKKHNGNGTKHTETTLVKPIPNKAYAALGRTFYNGKTEIAV